MRFAKAISFLSPLIILASPAIAQEQLRVAVTGGFWGDMIKECIYDNFTKATGIRVIPEPGISTVTLTKLRQQANRPTIDVAWLDGGISELADAGGLLAPIRKDGISDLEKLGPKAVYYNARGELFALSTGFYSSGIIYNKSAVKDPPTSWLDLWKPEYAGKVFIPSPNHGSGVLFFLLMAKVLGGNIENFDVAANELNKLKVSLYYDSGGQASTAFQGGEAIVGVQPPQLAWELQDKGLPYEFAIPKEGLIGQDYRVHIVKGTPRFSAALRLVNFAVGRESAECLAEKLYLGSPRSDLRISPKAADRMPWGKDGSVDNLVTFDQNWINENRSRIIQIWNERVVRR